MSRSESLRRIIVPGYCNSGEDHWQSHWQNRLGNSQRTNPASWESPEHDNWVAALEREVRSSDTPAVLIAHSLGTITVAEWAATHATDRVIGTLLVAIPDVQREDLPASISGFSNPLLEPLPFSAIAVLSSNDPYCRLDRGHHFANHFGARIEEVGDKGHINHDSNIGVWSEGLAWLDELERSRSGWQPQLHQRQADDKERPLTLF